MSSSLPSQISPAGLNPRNWRFTWEAQSHTSTLKLCLFNPLIEPATQFSDLKVTLVMEQFLLLVSFSNGEAQTSLRVPIPRIFIDHESPVYFRAYNDHIEVKLVLLLPVDHPLVSEFGSVSDDFLPLSTDSDLKKLSASEEVYFYCRSCSTLLTRPLRFFKEMPSVNWQDVADNWFGSCCCSFGGISEKMVTRYAELYTCTAGACLLDTASVIICKEDLVGCESLKWDQNHDEIKLNLVNRALQTRNMLGNGIQQEEIIHFKKVSLVERNIDGEVSHLCYQVDKPSNNLEYEIIENTSNGRSSVTSEFQDAENLVTFSACSTYMKDKSGNYSAGCCSLKTSEGSSKEQNPETDSELLAHQKLLLDGFLWNGFVGRSSNLSKDVQWVEFLCPQCSSLLGAYPCSYDNSMLDGGVRLFKCHISTSLPVLDSNDLFRYYSLERMFSIQLLENANEELSFRTVIRDMQTNYPILQLVLLNPDSWCHTGYCLGTTESAARINMYPTTKLLFSDCSKEKELESRKLEQQISNDEVEELYMLPSLIKGLITCLESANGMYPPSQTSIQGLCLSSMKR